jgi:hypothetical protein
MRFFSLLGADAAAITYDGGIFNTVLKGEWFQKQDNHWLGQIVAFLGRILVPVTIVILAAAVVWCVYLGIQLARAEDAGKAGDIKKRLINVAVAFVITLAAIWIIASLMAFVPDWLGRNDVTGDATMIETSIRSFIPKL